MKVGRTPRLTAEKPRGRRWWLGATALAAVTAPAAGILLARSPVAGGRELSDSELQEQVESSLERQARDDRFSGTVLVARNGAPIVARAVGMADRETQTRNELQTVYGLASVGKMFTAVAIGQLAEQARLDLDAPIGTYLPDYPAAVANTVTAKHLLSHTSGIPDFLTPRDPETYRAVIGSRQPHRDYQRIFAGQPLRFKPGARWEYGNSGFVLLGAMIERVSGQSYYEYVRTHIFGPAGMDATFWEAQEVEPGRLARGYTHLGPDGRPTPGERRAVDPTRTGPMLLPAPARGGAYGGGFATAGDLLKFLVAVRRFTLLGEQHSAALLTGPENGPANRSNYAYGFDFRQAYGRRAIGHGGDAPGVQNFAYMYPGNCDVVVLSNYDSVLGHNSSGAKALMAVLDDLLLR